MLSAVLCWLSFALQNNLALLSFQGISLSSFAENFAAMLLYVSMEELFCRALLIPVLFLLGKKEWVVLLLSSLLFAGLHTSNYGADALSFLSHSLGGLIYGLAFIRTHSLLLPVVLHFSWNFIQGPVFGMSVSGEVKSGFFSTTITGGAPWVDPTYGIEGGILGIGIRLLILFVLVAYLQKKEKISRLKKPLIRTE